MTHFSRSILVACLALAGLSAHAADYYIVTPVKGRVVNLSAIQVALGASTLPAGQLGSAYSYDFKQNLQVTGDPGYTGYGVSWSVISGVVPAGLTLNAATGVLSGTPTAAGTSNFTVAATYKTKPGAQPYTVVVANAQALIALTANTDTNFGTVAVGSTASKSFTVTNSGIVGATGVYAQVVGTGLSLTSNTCGTNGSPLTVAPGAGTCALTVQYSPATAGALTGAALNVYSTNAVGSPFSLALTGTAESPYVQATGGTVLTPGDGYRYHLFTSTGGNSFVVAGSSSQAVEVLVVGGGGGGGRGLSGSYEAGGGGAGGYINTTYVLSGGAQTIALTVGAGGAAGAVGAASTFAGVTALGGGSGCGNGGGSIAGGSGGGGCSLAGYTPGGSGTGGQGNSGGAGVSGGYSGGGGGAGAAGTPGATWAAATANTAKGGAGACPANFALGGADGCYAGGGGGVGRAGGVGGGASGSNAAGVAGAAGMANTGGGGGAGNSLSSTVGGAGGSGVVIVRYPYQ